MFPTEGIYHRGLGTAGMQQGAKCSKRRLAVKLRVIKYPEQYCKKCNKEEVISIRYEQLVISCWQSTVQTIKKFGIT